MTDSTLGGSGVGPAVIRYCLMNGLGAGFTRPATIAEPRALLVALEIVDEAVPDVVVERDGEAPEDDGEHAENRPHDPQDRAPPSYRPAIADLPPCGPAASAGAGHPRQDRGREVADEH